MKLITFPCPVCSCAVTITGHNGQCPKCKADITCFYRAAGAYGFLSNLFPCHVTFESRVFRSSEDAYQFGKAKDPAVAEWLISAPKPHLCAMAAHTLTLYDVRPDWDGIKVDRMRAVVRAKFSEHPDLAAKLHATGKAILVEASQSDAFWRVGKSGKGVNVLGKLLMEVRADSQQPIAYAVATKGSNGGNGTNPAGFPCPRCRKEIIDKLDGESKCSRCRADVIAFSSGDGDYGWLSNLFPCHVNFEQQVFQSAESAYQFGRPRDANVAKWLTGAPKPHLCEMAAQRLFWYDIQPRWNAIKVDRMRAVVMAKFQQHSDLMAKLRVTGNAVLVNAAQTDAFWGIGKKGKGKNMLGKLLMELRP
jgi:hypothetical protein